MQRNFIYGIAIVLIIVGVIFLSYSGFHYTTQEQVAQIGSLKVIDEKQKTIPFSPIIGSICLAVGIGLIAFNRMKR